VLSDKTILASSWIGFGSELIGSLSFIDAEIKAHDLAMGVDAKGRGLCHHFRDISEGELPVLISQVAVDDEVVGTDELSMIVDV
jgi:hypothetical protein